MTSSTLCRHTPFSRCSGLEPKVTLTWLSYVHKHTAAASGHGIRAQQLYTATVCGKFDTVHMVHGFKHGAMHFLFFSRSASMEPISSKLGLLHDYKLGQDELLITILSVYREIRKKKKTRKRRWWVHPILQRRCEQGCYHRLVQELQLDGEMFKRYFRLTREQFAQLQLFDRNNVLCHLSTRTGNPSHTIKFDVISWISITASGHSKVKNRYMERSKLPWPQLDAVSVSACKWTPTLIIIGSDFRCVRMPCLHAAAVCLWT